MASPPHAGKNHRMKQSWTRLEKIRPRARRITRTPAGCHLQKWQPARITFEKRIMKNGAAIMP